MKKKLLSLIFVSLAVGALSGCGKPEPKAECGDGKLSPEELCDTGIKSGNGVCPTEETCEEDDKVLEGTQCQAHCVVPLCGNGKVDEDEGETCDPGDNSPKDCIPKSKCESKNRKRDDILRGADAKKWVYKEARKNNLCTSTCKEVDVDCDSEEFDGVCLDKCNVDNDLDCAIGAKCIPGDSGSGCELLKERYGVSAQCVPGGGGKGGICVVGVGIPTGGSAELECSLSCPVGTVCDAPLGKLLAYCAPKCTGGTGQGTCSTDSFFCSPQHDNDRNRSSKGYSICQPKLCDPAVADACGTNSKCMESIFKCVAYANGSVELGKPCENSGECKGGWGAECYAPFGRGVCTKFNYANVKQAVSSDFCPNGFATVSDSQDHPNVAFCLKVCNDDTVCTNFDPSLSCQKDVWGGGSYKVCLPSGNKKADVTNGMAPCMEKSACKGKNAICLVAEDKPGARGFCTANCYRRNDKDKTMAVTCLDDYSCKFFDDEGVVGDCYKNCTGDSDCDTAHTGTVCLEQTVVNGEASSKTTHKQKICVFPAK